MSKKTLRSIVALLLVAAISAGYYIYLNRSKDLRGSDDTGEYIEYSFRNRKLLEQHYEKHGKYMGFDSPEAYIDGANRVINDSDSLHKKEAEDNDDIYYLEASNEFVVVSTDGYIRTYFNPDSGIKYYDKQ